MKTFFFFGDSITLGVNDAPAGGWVGRFAGLAAQAGLPVPPSTFYNLGVRKHAAAAHIGIYIKKAPGNSQKHSHNIRFRSLFQTDFHIFHTFSI